MQITECPRCRMRPIYGFIPYYCEDKRIEEFEKWRCPSCDCCFVGNKISGAYTKEEVRKRFLSYIKLLAEYWAYATIEEKEYTMEDRLMGLVHSILVVIDGGAGGFPCAINLVLDPHPADKQCCIENKEKYYESGMSINDDCALHECL